MGRLFIEECPYLALSSLARFFFPRPELGSKEILPYLLKSQLRVFFTLNVGWGSHLGFEQPGAAAVATTADAWGWGQICGYHLARARARATICFVAGAEAAAKVPTKGKWQPKGMGRQWSGSKGACPLATAFPTVAMRGKNLRPPPPPTYQILCVESNILGAEGKS